MSYFYLLSSKKLKSMKIPLVNNNALYSGVALVGNSTKKLSAVSVKAAAKQLFLP